MAQVTVYLDDETEQQVKAAAQSAGLSLSHWVRMVIREKTARTWPKEVLELAGAWPDFPDVEELRAPR